MKRILFLSLLFGGFSVQAAPQFSCTAYTQEPVQAFQYTSRSCGGADKSAVSTNPDQTDVLCVYHAACRVLLPNEPLAPPPAPVDALDMNAFEDGTLKRSELHCKGTGTLGTRPALVQDANPHYVNAPRELVSFQCPPPSVCATDVFFNLSTKNDLPRDMQKTYAPQEAVGGAH